MKSSLPLIILTLCVFLTTLSGANEKLTFTSNSGKQIEGAEVVAFLGDSVVLSQSTGELTLPYKDLPEDIRNQLEISRYALANNPPAALKDLRAATDTKLRAEEAFDGQKVVLKDYLTALGSLKKEMIEGGLILEALKVAEESRRVERQLRVDDFKDRVKLEGDPIWVYNFPAQKTDTGELTITPQTDSWLLEKGPKLNATIRSDRRFTPPFKIVADVRPTTESEVRLMYPERFIARFYSQGNQPLVLYLPQGSNKTFSSQGKLDTTRFQQIVINVWPDRVEAYVDGVLRGEYKGDFSTQSSPVGISPFRDCPVEVKRFGVWPLN